MQRLNFGSAPAQLCPISGHRMQSHKVNKLIKSTSNLNPVIVSRTNPAIGAKTVRGVPSYLHRYQLVINLNLLCQKVSADGSLVLATELLIYISAEQSPPGFQSRCNFLYNTVYTGQQKHQQSEAYWFIKEVLPTLKEVSDKRWFATVRAQLMGSNQRLNVVGELTRCHPI